MNKEVSQKRVAQAEYRAKMVEAELAAVKNSRAYRAAKLAGLIKAQIKTDPVGLSKKAAKVFLSNPKKMSHLLRRVNRGVVVAESVAEQNAKYREWILLNEPDELELEEQRRHSEAFTRRPTISLLTPVFNPPVDVLEDLIESVLEQTYPHFELCLGNFGDKQEVEELIAKYAKLDPRVKHYTFSENKGISYNSNLILEKVTGEYVALLDHDDTLAPDALYENIKLLNEKEYDFIYSDKDKIDGRGNRFDPLFKPELSPEMLLNVNYLTHLNVIRTSLLREVGGWDTETDGAQDWDIFLRVIAASKRVGHISKVLYHWRVIPSSTAMSIDAKPYALAGQRRALDKYLSSQHIPATTYHQRTEVFLKWGEKALDYKPLVFIRYSSLPSTLRTIRHFRRVVPESQFTILLDGNEIKDDPAIIKLRTGTEVVRYDGSFAHSFSDCLRELKENKHPDCTVVFTLDILRIPRKPDWYENLTGWLSIKDVAAAGGRIVNKHDIIVNSGGLVTKDNQYFPIFNKYPRYYQSYIGNAEWVRNLSVLSPDFFATRLSLLQSFSFDALKAAEARQSSFDQFFLWLSHRYRLVMTPHVTTTVLSDSYVDTARTIQVGHRSKSNKFVERFNNINMSSADPMRLFEDEPLIGLDNGETAAQVDQYQHDARILTTTFDITAEELQKNHEIVRRKERLTSPNSVAWFLPSFDGIYAGLMNIFSFADYLVDKRNLKSTFYILKGDTDTSVEESLIVGTFPALKEARFISLQPNREPVQERYDIGIATQWATAFPLAKAENIGRKCYFIQDNEVNFYPKGSISALVELTYQFGFTAIAGTEGLLDMYQERYGGKGVVLKSLVDLSAYHPRKNQYYVPSKPYKVFFYARPNMPRNAFELGLAGLAKLKEELGSNVEIITAGSQWDTAAYGANGIVTNLGKIAYDAVPKLYRSVDVGLMFMFSGHPGVTASELMASGCPVVVNEYEDMTWHELYQHEKTCLITKSTASEISRNIKRCLEDNKLRRRIIEGGMEKASTFYANYHASQQHAYDEILKG